MKMIMTIVVALILGSTIVGCVSSSQAIAQTELVNDENVSLPEVEEDAGVEPTNAEDPAHEWDYDKIFAKTIGADRDAVQKTLGLPSETRKEEDGLYWSWKKKAGVGDAGDINVEICAFFGNDKNTKEVSMISVAMPTQRLDNNKYLPLCKKYEDFIRNIRGRKIYGGGGLSHSYSYVITGKFGDTDVQIICWSPITPFDEKESVDSEGMLKRTTFINPKFKWIEGKVESIAFGPIPRNSHTVEGIEWGLKRGEFALIEGG